MHRPSHPLNRLATSTLALLIAALCPAAGHGQGRPDTVVTRLDSVAVTAARAPAAAGGASILVVRPGQLPFPVPPAASLADILREVPFVLVRQNSRGENEISMRGAESRQAAILVDGIPVTLGWDGRVDPSLLPLTGVRRVTVTRGLASLTGGPNVLGGVIEFSPADAAGRGTAAQPDVGFHTGVDQYGAFGASAHAGTRLQTGAGQVTVRAGLGRRARDGFALSRDGGASEGPAGSRADPGQDGEGRLRTNSDLAETDAFVAARLSGGGGRFAGVTVTGFEAERGVPGELHVASPRLWRYPTVSRRLVVGSLGTGAVTTPAGAGSLAASLGISTGDLEIESYTDATYTTVTAREFGSERTATWRVLGTHTLGPAGQLRTSHTRSETRYDERFNTGPIARYRQVLSSTAVDTEWEVGASSQLALGIVHDRGSTPESGGREPLGALSRTGWRVGASTTGLGEGVRLHAAVSRRSRFPALRELYSGALNRFVPNPDLKPETLVGAELGATLAGGVLGRAGISVQGVLFAHVLHDAVVRVTLPNRLFQRVNRDEIRSHGLELVADWASADRRRGEGGWTVSTDLVVQRVRVRDLLAGTSANDRRAEHQPAVRGSVDVGAPLPGGLRGVAGMRVTGRQYCQHPDQGALVALEAQAAGHAALSREWRPAGWRLGSIRGVLAVDNLTDASVYDQCGLPQPGRTVRVGLELR